MVLKLNPLPWYLLLVATLSIVSITALHYGALGFIGDRFPGYLTQMFGGGMLTLFLLTFMVVGCVVALRLRAEDRTMQRVRAGATVADGSHLAVVLADLKESASIDSVRKIRVNPFVDKYQQRLEAQLSAIGTVERVLMYLGLIGTVFGIALAFSPQEIGSVNNADDALVVSFAFLSQIGLAVSTTALGIVSALLLMVLRDGFEAKVNELVSECGVLLEQRLLVLHQKPRLVGGTKHEVA